MRFIFGVIIGCLVTVGAAYVHDTATPSDAQVGSVDGPMVNWTVVDKNLSDLDTWAHAQWVWLSGRLNKAAG